MHAALIEPPRQGIRRTKLPQEPLQLFQGVPVCCAHLQAFRAPTRTPRCAPRPQETAAVIIEPILGEGGFLTPPPGFLTRLRELCDQHGMLLIFDEVLGGRPWVCVYMCVLSRVRARAHARVFFCVCVCVRARACARVCQCLGVGVSVGVQVWSCPYECCS